MGRPWLVWLVCGLAIATFVALGLTALVTHEISLAGRLRVASLSGVAAEIMRFGLLLLAGLIARLLYERSRYRKLFDAALVIAWATGALIYFLT